MEWLNYQHLYYFWAVARYGTVVRASRELGLAQPTISGQIGLLEKVLGEQLFDRTGRRLVLTEVGKTVFEYAEEIFSLGKDLMGALQGRQTVRPLQLRVGIAEVLPKASVYRLLEPAFHIGKPVRMICREDRAVEDFLGPLAVQELDLVLSDRPIGRDLRVRAFSHLLGECGTTLLAKGALARSLRARFPQSLNGAPFLLPSAHATLRRSLDQWFETNEIRPTVVAEFDDSALMAVFGQEGSGVFACPTLYERDFQRRYDVRIVGRAEDVVQQFFAISVERRIKNPAVIAIVEAARAQWGHEPGVVSSTAPR
jgi:LysR family transcriptional activator of nhaA